MLDGEKIIGRIKKVTFAREKGRNGVQADWLSLLTEITQPICLWPYEYRCLLFAASQFSKPMQTLENSEKQCTKNVKNRLTYTIIFWYTVNNLFSFITQVFLMLKTYREISDHPNNEQVIGDLCCSFSAKSINRNK